MLPNGGFPPLKKCQEKKSKNDKNKDEKGFFYTTSNNINIREILKKKLKSETVDPRKEDDLEIVDTI